MFSELEVRCLSQLNQSSGVYFDVRVICGEVLIILMFELQWIKIFSEETRSTDPTDPIGSFKLTLASNIFALGIFLNCFRAIKHNKLFDDKNSCSMSQNPGMNKSIILISHEMRRAALPGLCRVSSLNPV